MSEEDREEDLGDRHGARVAAAIRTASGTMNICLLGMVLSCMAGGLGLCFVFLRLIGKLAGFVFRFLDYTLHACAQWVRE